ncbi:phage major capsid protein [Oscillibacter ruminantium]|uniref:phage major capsid protein n=1 Tax=Oscillibacter ruminantium TaxID=1263547 RepID=UPI0002F69A9D|nr:phage major capsid protein [Oscillibacter ruminantium]
MDYLEKINDLRAQKAELSDKAEKLVMDGKFDEADALTTQMEGINSNIDTVIKAMQASQKNAGPVDLGDDGILVGGKKPEAKDAKKDLHLFDSIGEQLRAIVAQTKHVGDDKRLSQINNVVQGVGTGSGEDGAFAIQSDFAGAIMESAVQNSPLLQRLDRYTCSASSNSARWLRFDETDISESVFGGIKMHWAAEGGSVAASKPSSREMRLDLEKMMGFMYATDEMLQDTAFLTGLASTGFSLAADRLLTAAVINGDGAGKPLGIMQSGALVSVAKEASQAAATLLGDNIIKMQARAMPRNRERLCWLMHPDLEEQLPYLAIKSGDASKFLWNPEGGLGNFDTQRVLNKPVLFDDNCAAIGSKGDILLVDPFQYVLLMKGTAKQDWSMHVEFLTDQQCFRIVWRCNGAPKVDAPLTIKNSTKKRSPFVTLDARA